MKKIQFAPKLKRVRYTAKEKVHFLEKVKITGNLS